MRVAFIDTVHPILKSRLQEKGFECTDHLSVSRGEILTGALSEIEGIVLRSRLEIDSDVLASMPKLKWIARSGSGLENIDLEDALNRNILVFNSPEGNRDAVGEHTLGMLLMILHKLRSCDVSVHNRVWDREGHRGHELAYKTVGIIGYGVMGTSFAKKLEGLGCKVIAYDKYITDFGSKKVEEVSESIFFEQSDVVSIHLPLTDETTDLVDETWISRFHKPIILLNTSRGSIVNTLNLLEAMDKGIITASALDVLEFEGKSLEKLEYNSNSIKGNTLNRLLQNPNIILSPHVAGWTVESYEKLSTYLADKILAKFPQT